MFLQIFFVTDSFIRPSVVFHIKLCVLLKFYNFNNVFSIPSRLFNLSIYTQKFLTKYLTVDLESIYQMLLNYITAATDNYRF